MLLLFLVFQIYHLLKVRASLESVLAEVLGQDWVKLPLMDINLVVALHENLKVVKLPIGRPFQRAVSTIVGKKLLMFVNG